MSIEFPVIVIAAYGTGEAAAQKELESVDTLVRKRFPNNEVRWALTARWLIARLRKEGKTTIFSRQVPVKNLEEVYTDVRNEGKRRVAVMLLLVHKGSESDAVLSLPAPGLEVRYGAPLLSIPGNMEGTVKAIAPYFGTGKTSTILVGHGVDDKPELNQPFIDMEEYAARHYPNVFMVTIHGPPGKTKAIDKVRESSASEVVFVPLMITNSEHILHEIMADAPESCRNRLGLPARLAPSFAETPAVMDLYLDSLSKALASFSGSS